MSNELLETLSLPEQHAVMLIKTAIDSYNSFDGTGLFAGMERYQVLEGRVRIAAAQAQSLFQFWAILLRKMLWPTPSAIQGEKILPMLQSDAEEDILRALYNETAPIIMLARSCAEESKKSPKE